MEKRKKLGGTAISTLKGQESEVSKQVGKKGDRAGYLTIDKGWNKFRFMPAHPGTESFMYASVRYFVPVDVSGDDGKVERKNKSVFNSKVHGGTEKDVIEEYIKFLQEETLSHLQGPSLDAALKPIIYGGTHNLQPKVEWVLYADKYDKSGKKIGFGRLPITPGTKNKLEKLIATEDADQAIVIEPFTDEEDGVAVILTYNPDAKDAKGKKDMKNFYTVDLEQRKEGKFKIELVPTPLSEKDIEEFLKQESLESMFKNSYKLKDFNIALSGLQIIDKECKFGVLKDSRFLEIVEEIRAYYPEDGEEAPEKGEVEDSEVSEVGDDLDKLDRNGLKKLILAEFGQGVVIVRTNNSDDDIRDMIRDKRSDLATQEPEVVEEEAMVEEASEEAAPQIDKTNDLPFDVKGTAGSDSLKAMREKMLARNKK